LYGADYGSGEGTTASVGDLTHELFHTWDLQHAQARNSMSAGPSADKLYRPYGNLTDVMGGASSPPPPRRRRP
jgi:hypothetical protein